MRFFSRRLKKLSRIEIDMTAVSPPFAYPPEPAATGAIPIVPDVMTATQQQQHLAQQLHIAARPAQIVGQVTEVAGGRALCLLDRAQLSDAHRSADFSVQLAGQIGSYLKVQVASSWVFTSVRAVRAGSTQMMSDQAPIIAELDFVGEALVGKGGSVEGFRRGITRYPSPGASLQTVSVDDLEQVFSARGRPHIRLGLVYPTDRVKAALFIDPMLSKHFALLGSTGTGKSTTVALILHRIIEQAQQGHILMLDPHGEYAAAFKDNGVVYDSSNMELPYWLMNFEEHVEVLIGKRTPETEMEVDILAKCLLAARSKSRLAAEIGRVTVDSPIPYLLSDLIGALQVNMGKLDKPEKVGPYMKLKSKIEELKSDPRYAFMFSGLLVSDIFSDFLARIFRMPADGRPISIMDLSGIPSDVVNVVVAVLSRLVFDFAVWSKNDSQRPILLVCEEAHRYVPAERLDTFGPARKILERIAKEGRKYGVSLGLVSQRPSDLSESVLSQCGTIISLRMNNDRDQAYVRNAMPEGARGFLDTLPALRNREAIVCGEGVSIPIRVRIDNLEANKRPSSDDPAFSALWAESGGERDLVARVVRKWRAQGR
jgi:uncharacterized protein